MTKENQSERKPEQNGDFDIVWLVRYLWAERMLIAKCTGVAVVISLIMFLAKDKVFTASASLLPCAEESAGSSLKSLSGLASMAGVNIGSMGGSTTSIPPDLYEEVVMSTSSMLKLIDIPLTWNDPDTVLSIYEHMRIDTVPTFADNLLAYTIGLPMTIKNAISPAPKIEAELPDPDSKKLSIIKLDEVRYEAIKELRSRISVAVDDNVELVRVNVNAPNDRQCSELAIAIIEQIQSSITEYKTENARKVLDFVAQRLEEVQQDYDDARQRYFAYTDTHRDYVRERSDAVRQKLEDAYNTNYSLLQAITQSHETAKMKLMENSPAFSIVEPVVTPYKKTSPRGSLHLIGGVAAGLILTIGFLLVRLGYWQVFEPKRFRAIYDEFMTDEE